MKIWFNIFSALNVPDNRHVRLQHYIHSWLVFGLFCISRVMTVWTGMHLFSLLLHIFQICCYFVTKYFSFSFFFFFCLSCSWAGILFLGAFAKLRRDRLVCLSIRPHGTTRLLHDRSSWNMIFEYFSKISRENLGLIKIWQEWRVLYTKTNTHVWSYLAQFFL